MNEKETLRAMISKYKEIKVPVEQANLYMSQYETFKRYTTSKRDHGPQMRLNSNVRKRWPIIISKTNRVPFKFNGIQLKTKEDEIGEAKCVRASIFVPDYLSKYGNGTELEIAKALIKPELDKVDRFLNIMHTDVQYNEFHPYRKRTKIEPTIEDVSPSSVNATIAMAFLPNFITPEYFRASNALAVRELKNQLHPLLKLKTTSDIIHQARKLIATKTKWVPSIVDINPRLAEILHYVCGPYHLLSVGNLGELNQMSYERLFQDIAKVCLNSGDPLSSFRSSLDSIHIFETPLREQVFHVPGARPFTLIAKALVGAPIDVESRVRETRFVVVDSVGNMKQSALLCGMGQAQYVHQFKWWEGKETVFFENEFIKGYVNKENRSIISVELNTLPTMTNMRPVLLDLMFYCRAAETGFDKDFPVYIIEERRKRYFFEYHEKHPQDMFKVFGVSTKGIVSLDCYYGEPSNGYLEKVNVCASTVQPYSIKSWDYRVGKDLTVFKKMGNREVEVQAIAEMVYDTLRCQDRRNAVTQLLVTKETAIPLSRNLHLFRMERGQLVSSLLLSAAIKIQLQFSGYKIQAASGDSPVVYYKQQGQDGQLKEDFQIVRLNNKCSRNLCNKDSHKLSVTIDLDTIKKEDGEWRVPPSKNDGTFDTVQYKSNFECMSKLKKEIDL
ncbi:hypothetical protein JTE90_028676 [Oedothorax gibbosus]|uniref:Polymerase basic protein 2 cap-binding domain-containing protein n=1 Tax=Oedothorax gibbosus TaxID=931172 RepID=A0AAV6TFZ6_9ARAC|nr:hypothetical protein JTE90_028676 [Oedothorax gibbosus]